MCVLDRCDVADADRRAFVGLDDDLFDLVNSVKLTDDADGEFAWALSSETGGHVEVGVSERCFDLGYVQFVRGEALPVDDDADFAYEAAIDTCGRDADDLLELGLDVIAADVIEPAHVLDAGNLDGDNRLEAVGVNLYDDWSAGGIGQAVGYGVNSLAGVEGCPVHVLAPLEVDGDDGQAFLGGGGDAVVVLDGCGGFLDGLGDELLDLFGRSARVRGDDGDDGYVHVGEQGQGELPVPDEADDEDGGDDHDDSYGALDR